MTEASVLTTEMMDWSSFDGRALHAALLDHKRREGLAARLTPWVKARAARTLRRCGACTPDELADVCQEALLTLFADDARTLRSWNAERGLSLAGFVQLVTERVVLKRLKRGWASRGTQSLDGCEDRPADSMFRPDRRVVTRGQVERVMDCLQAEVSARGLELFRALFVEQQSLHRVCQEFGMQPDAVYAWRSRLNKRARAIFRAMDPPSTR